MLTRKMFGRIIIWFGFFIMIPAFIPFIVITLLTRDLYNQDWSSSSQYGYMCLSLLGCFIILVGKMVGDGLQSPWFVHMDWGKYASATTKVVGNISIFLLLAGMWVSLTLFFFLTHFRKTIGREILDFLGWVSIFSIAIGLLGIYSGKILFISSLYKLSVNSQIATKDIYSLTRKWRKCEIFSKWGILLAVVGFIFARVLTARNWIFIWPQEIGYFGGWDAVYILIVTICVVSLILFIIFCLTIMILVAGTTYNDHNLSGLGFIIGCLLLVLGTIQTALYIGWIRHSWAFRPGGEFGAMLIGAGICLAGRSRLPNIRFGHSICVILGGTAVGLFFIVSLESWFSIDVPLLWLNGFLGILIPGLSLLALGFEHGSIEAGITDSGSGN